MTITHANLVRAWIEGNPVVHERLPGLFCIDPTGVPFPELSHCTFAERAALRPVLERRPDILLWEIEPETWRMQ
jgi:hypothetical protein